ncbi:MAG: hypothetical protein AB7V27_18780 [Candidatus Binatia bacterium]
MMRLLLFTAASAVLLGSTAARGESCSPAMCAGMSPVCWQAYEKVVVEKDERIKSVTRCRELAADLDGAGHFMKVPDLTPRQALCACEAAFWSIDGGAQGLPNMDDTSQERSNSDEDD